MKAKKILVCDDDDGILDMMTLMLEAFGYAVIAEKNSLNVMNLLHTARPDLLILDLWMPVLSGDQILLTLRANPALRDLPVLVVSASRDGEKIAKASGATSYIQKPFNMNTLAEKIKETIS